MRELFFEYLTGMIEKGVTPDLAAELSAKLLVATPPLPTRPPANTSQRQPAKKKAAGGKGGGDAEELQKILDGVAWPLPWKEAIHAAAKAADITPGRASFKLMSLAKQRLIGKNADGIYERTPCPSPSSAS